MSVGSHANVWRMQIDSGWRKDQECAAAGQTVDLPPSAASWLSHAAGAGNLPLVLLLVPLLRRLVGRQEFH
jgi:hypothetical protein